MDDDLQHLLDAYHLKDERRTGWELRSVHDPESVAGHSWGVAFLTLLYGRDAGIDMARALQLAVVHDLAEAWTGDHLTRADTDQQEISAEEKKAQERQVMDRFASDMDTQELIELWEAYSAKETLEARFVKDMDLIDMVLQAYLYEVHDRYDPDEDNPAFEEYGHMDEFFTTAEPRLSTDTGKDLFVKIKEQYEQVKQG